MFLNVIDDGYAKLWIQGTCGKPKKEAPVSDKLMSFAGAPSSKKASPRKNYLAVVAALFVWVRLRVHGLLNRRLIASEASKVSNVFLHCDRGK